LRVTGKQESIDLGKRLLHSQLKKHNVKVSISDHIPMLLESSGMTSEEGFYEQLGKGNIPLNRVMQYFAHRVVLPNKGSRISRFVGSITDTLTGRDRNLSVGGTDHLMIRYAPCCNPVPGDDITGFMTKGRGISVHRKDCANAKLFMNDNDRGIEITWESEKQESRHYVVSLDITANNRKGLLSDISAVFVECDVDIKNGFVNTDNHFVYSSFQIEIRNASQLKQIVRMIQKIKDVEKVIRSKNKGESELS